MIKIAFLIDSIHFGGPGNVLRNMIRNIDRNLYDITVVLLFKNRNDKAIIDDFKELGVRIVRFDFKNKLEYSIYGKKKLNNIIKQYKFDIVHSHGICPDILNAVTVCKNKISTIHCNIFEDYEQGYGKFKSIFMTRFQIWALKKFNYSICVSKAVQNSIKSYLKNTAVVCNGIEPIKYEQYPDRSDLSIPQEAIVYIYIGSLSKRKNIVWLINQFHKHHLDNEYLLVFGKGALKEECLQIQDENIKVMGFLSDAKAYMKISDIYISASKSEGFAISVLEALDNGLGLFVSDIPSHKEVFEMADGLYLGEAFNSDNFGEKIISLRDNKDKISPDKIKEFKQKNLSAEKMIADYTEIYTNFS